MDVSQPLDSAGDTNSALDRDARIKGDVLAMESKIQDNFNLSSPRIRSPRRSPGFSPGGTTKLDVALDSLVARLTASVTASVSPHVKAECRRAVEARVSPLLQGSPRSPSSSSDGLRSDFSNTPRSPLRSPPYLSPGTLFTFDETPPGDSVAVNSHNREQNIFKEEQEQELDVEVEEYAAIPADSEGSQLPQPPYEDPSPEGDSPARPTPESTESANPSLPLSSPYDDSTTASQQEMAAERPPVVPTLQIPPTTTDAGALPFSPTKGLEAFGVVEENQANDEALAAVPTGCWSPLASPSANEDRASAPSPASPSSTVSESFAGSGERTRHVVESSPARSVIAWPSAARVQELGPTTSPNRSTVDSPNRLSVATATTTAPTTCPGENSQAYWALKACVEAAAEATVDASAHFELKYDALATAAQDAQAAAQEAQEVAATADAKCAALELELASAYKDARHADAHHAATVDFLQNSAAAELAQAQEQTEAATQRALEAEEALRVALDEVATVKAQHEKTTHLAQNHIEFLEGQLAARDQEVKQQAADLAVLRYAAEDGMKTTMRDAVAGAAEALSQQQQQHLEPSPSRPLQHHHHVTFRSPLSSPSPPASPASPPDVSVPPLQPALRASNPVKEGEEEATDNSSSSRFTFGGGGGRSSESDVAVAAKELNNPEVKGITAEDEEMQAPAQAAAQPEVVNEALPLPISETVSSETDAAPEVNPQAAEAAETAIETVIEAATSISSAEANDEAKQVIETVIEATIESSRAEATEAAGIAIETVIEAATEDNSSTEATEEAKVAIETVIEAATNAGDRIEATAEKEGIPVTDATDNAAFESTSEPTTAVPGAVATASDIETLEAAAAPAVTGATAHSAATPADGAAASVEVEITSSELGPEPMPTPKPNDASEGQQPASISSAELTTASTSDATPAAGIEKTENESNEVPEVRVETQAMTEAPKSESERVVDLEPANVAATEISLLSNEAESEATSSSAETEASSSAADAVAEEVVKPSEATISLEGMKPDEASALVWSKLKAWAAAPTPNDSREEREGREEDEGGNKSSEGGVVSLFKELDLDKSGTLDAKEFKAALAAIGLPGASNKVVETVMKAAAQADGSKGSKKVLDYASFASLLGAP